MSKKRPSWDTSIRAETLRLRNPLGDRDRDRIANVFDCQPFNPNQQGIHEFLSSVAGRVSTAITTGISTIKPVLSKYATKPISVITPATTYLIEASKQKPQRTGQAQKKDTAPSTYETVLAPTITHFKTIGELASKGEQLYETKITQPIEVSILGEREQALREQERQIERAYQQIQRYKKPEWKLTKEGAVILPTMPKPEVTAWEQRWKPYIKGGEFIGTESQFEQYKKEFRRFYEKVGKGEYVLKEEYLILTPEAQRYEEAIKRYKKAVKKYKSLPKPELERQFAAGFVSTIVSTPSFIGFTLPRVTAQSIVNPLAIPTRGKKYAQSLLRLAKERPGYFAGSVAGMVALGKAGKLKPYAERLSPLYVSPKRITPTPVLKEKMPSTGRVPVSTPAEQIKWLIESPEFKLTGRAEEVWHATPSRFELMKGGITYVKKGYSATKGLYVGYAAYPKFAVSSIIEAPRRVKLGEGKPTLYSILTKGVEIPKTTKVSASEILAAKRRLGRRAVPGSDIVKFAQYKKYVEEVAPRGYAYISPEATAKLPWRGYLEVEAVIPEASRMKEPLFSRAFTRFTYVKVPKFKLETPASKFFKAFETAWSERLKKATTKAEREKIAELYEYKKAKLLEEFRAAGELYHKGYEPVKLSVRRLVSKELTREEIKAAVKQDYLGLKGRFVKTPRIEITEFRPQSVLWRSPSRGLFAPYLLRGIGIASAYRERGARRKSVRRASEPLRMPTRRRETKREETKRTRRGTTKKRGRTRRSYPSRVRTRTVPELYRARERRAPERRRRGIRRTPSERRPPALIPPIITPRVSRTKPLYKQKTKHYIKRRKAKKEWEKYMRIAPVAKPEQVLTGSLKLLGGRR